MRIFASLQSACPGWVFFVKDNGLKKIWGRSSVWLERPAGSSGKIANLRNIQICPVQIGGDTKKHTGA